MSENNKPQSDIESSLPFSFKSQDLQEVLELYEQLTYQVLQERGFSSRVPNGLLSSISQLELKLIEECLQGSGRTILPRVSSLFNLTLFISP